MRRVSMSILLACAACGTVIGIPDREIDPSLVDGAAADAPAAEDSGPSPDAGADTSTAPDTTPEVRIQCGPLSCAGAEACCANVAGSYACGAGGVCPTGSDTLHCTTTRDCRGTEVCCLAGGAAGSYTSACLAFNSCTSKVIPCDPQQGTADCFGVSACSTSANATWNLPPAIGICKG